MGQSYRVRTELGVNKTIQVQLDQEFEFLEILSLQLQQEDIYIRACSDYGVIVGRVTANNGLGIPNARVSVFVPIEVLDESNPVIQSIYPYKSPTDKNEDGFRYNLLPYEKSHSGHSPTGTLPTRLDVLTGKTVTEIFDKYYKFTARTNDSGDYMIMGVPVGEQNLVMDVDLSDIGEFSLTPQDLIRMGLATESQVAGNRFRSSNDLNSLPQIINISKTIEVSPLWGEASICQVAINRLDFDLRDDANVDIQPTAVFMGSIFSTSDGFRLRGKNNAKIKDDFGNLCQLQAGPGQILAIRQTIFQGTDGNPILEQYRLEQNGNVIDGNGAWLVELPMNLDYFVTNEFGERVLSYDPTIGIPTKSKYRFKIKWQQSSDLTEQVRRPYYLVPNVREFGWTSPNADPNQGQGGNQLQLASSYYFGLDWSGYTQGITSNTLRNTKLNEIINCEDTFYQFDFNRVYTVSALIDQYKNGGRGRFVGIKEIDSNECSETVNKFPVNEGFRNFDLIYFLFAFLMQIFQIIGLPLIVAYHIMAYLWNNFAVVILSILGAFILRAIAQTTAEAVAFISAAIGNPFTINMLIAGLAILLRIGFYSFLAIQLAKNFKALVKKKFGPISLPMVQYPDCQACDCKNGEVSNDSTEGTIPPPGVFTQTSNQQIYDERIKSIIETQLTIPPEDETYEQVLTVVTQIVGQALAGNSSKPENPTIFKTTKSQIIDRPPETFALSLDLPAGERINTYNLRQKYFNNFNKIKVTFNSPQNYTTNTQRAHYDNTLTVLASESLQPGDLISFINPNSTTDKNFQFTGNTTTGIIYNGIWGKKPTAARQITVNYATSQLQDQSVVYNIPSGETPTYVDSFTVNVTEADPLGNPLRYTTALGEQSAVTLTIGTHVISDVNCIQLDSVVGDLEFTITSFGQECMNYSYPADIEYYQVITAITITQSLINNIPVYSLPSLAPVNSNGVTANPSFWNLLINPSTIITFDRCPSNSNVRNPYGTNPTNNPRSVDGRKLNSTYIDGFKDQKVLILQRGVDPYSPKYINRYGIGRILGHSSEDAVVVTAATRFNIPIQKLPNNSPTTVQQHNSQSNIFNTSYFFTPGIPGNNKPGFSFIPYTTSNVGFYGRLDSIPSTLTGYTGRVANVYNSQSYVSNQTNGSVLSRISNGFNSSPNSGFWPPNFFSGTIDSKYDNSEDLSGGAVLFGNLTVRTGSAPSCNPAYYIGEVTNSNPSIPIGDVNQIYFSPSLLPTLSATPLSISSSPQIVMRTDRLPSSDFNDNGGNWLGSVSLLQQNLGFQIYNLEGGGSVAGLAFSTGAQQPTADIEGQFAAANVFESLNTCSRMVGLDCYSGNGVSFGIKTNCDGTDSIDNGCYVMVKKPLTDLFNKKDFNAFAEWGYRYRFFYGLCRGVLSQSFTNNWVNGSLFMFPIQIDRYFDRNNKPLPPDFPKKLIYFDSTTNNFYFRSSPFISGATNPFPGQRADTDRPNNSLNTRNLLFPTTIMNLGMKDSFYDEIMFEPSTAAYVMDRLNPSSYSDTSDIVNLFVISRITDTSFLSQLVPLKNDGLNQLFSRNGTTLFVQPKQRVDADFAQMISINSEVGLIPFSPEFYPFNGTQNDAVKVIGALNTTPTMGIYFSSTTFNLQDKDFLSPGVINFRPNPNNTAITYQYGIRSQQVPFYRWEIKQGQSPNIFGTERNNWLTSSSDIGYLPYQSLSRRRIIDPHYYTPTNTTLDIYQRGYIFDVDSNGNYLVTPPQGVNNKIVVGAPYHFYFGLIKGETALDKFKTKYGINE